MATLGSHIEIKKTGEKISRLFLFFIINPLSAHIGYDR
jgi:hypothetical protein